MAIETKSLISSTPAKSTASRLATTKNVNNKVIACKAVGASELKTAEQMKTACCTGKHIIS